jgi:hypothetical protein
MTRKETVGSALVYDAFFGRRLIVSTIVMPDSGRLLAV